MELLDVSIITLYFALTLSLKIWISKRASRGLDSFFLNGKFIKWYYLGLSNGSGMFDVSGTAWMVGILFLYGVKSLFYHGAINTYNGFRYSVGAALFIEDAPDQVIARTKPYLLEPAKMYDL